MAAIPWKFVAIAWLCLASDEATWSTRLQRRIESLRVREGPLAGGYRLQENDGRINWYFSNLGLLPMCDRRPDDVRAHLDLYLRQVRKDTCTIRDIKDIASGATQEPDSDDSYAATLLSLAVKYRTASGDRSWWAANRSMLKRIARRVLIDSQREDGLVSAFAADPRRRTAYVMDNCEVYRGLSDLAGRLLSDGDPEAEEFAAAAARVANGLANLFDERRGRFPVADVPAGDGFYPLRAAQAFPETFGVPLGDARRTRRRYDAAWAFLHAAGDRWEIGEVRDGSLGGYPWMMLGHTAALRGRTDLAIVQLADFEFRLLCGDRSASRSAAVHELGWALRTRDLLGGDGPSTWRLSSIGMAGSLVFRAFASRDRRRTDGMGDSKPPASRP